MSGHDAVLLLHYAMRYALGRFTYAVDDVCRIMKEQWTALPERERSIILADLDTEILRAEKARKHLGMESQHQQWRDLRDWIVNKEQP